MVIFKSLIFLLFLVLASTGWGRLSFNLIRDRSLKEKIPSIAYPALGLGIISYLSLIAGLTGYFNLIALSLIYVTGLVLYIATIPNRLKEHTSTSLKPYVSSAIFRGYGEYCIRFLYCAYKSGLMIKEMPVIYKLRRTGRSKTLFLKHTIDYILSVLELRLRGLV